jgi:N-acetylglutamate synthase-like GNAT family acetyltransferase
MIIEVKNHILIPKILKLAGFIKDTPIEKLREMLIEAVNSTTSKILVEKKDDEIRAFLLASVEIFDGEKSAFIQSCYIDPHAKGVGYQILNRVSEWAKEKGLSNIYMMTSRSPAPFIRKYKFQFQYSVLKRRL